MTRGMRVRAAGLACAVAIGMSSAPLGAATSVEAKDDTAALFGAREAVSDPALSPDGARVLYLAADYGAGTMLMVAAADGSSAPHLVTASSTAATRLEHCDWADNSRIVCMIYGITEAEGTTLSFERLIAVDADGGGRLAMLNQTRSSNALLRDSVYGGDVVDWMQGDTGKLLIARDHVPEESIGTHLAQDADGLGVDLIDTHSLVATKVETADPQASDYISDGKGTVRLMARDTMGSGGYLTGKTSWSYRTPTSRQWHSFSEVTVDGSGLSPVSVDPSTDVAYSFAKKDGRKAFYRVALDGSMRADLVYADPQVDVDDVVRLGRQARLIGYTTDTEKRQITYFDPADTALAKALSKALSNLPIVEFVGASADEKKLLLFAGSDVDPGRYYVFDRLTRHLNEIALVRPQLEHITLGAMTPITYKAADGTIIPAYLTLPPGGTKTGLPAIVMPHGGPAARDDWGFDWLAQFYAARGYAVLQPEYRGSTGYGDQWQGKNGFRSWRTAIGDIDDAGRWLIAQHIADPAKLAIVGWSYGGYAALQSQVVDPDLFKAVVATAPVTDLGMLKEEHAPFVNAIIASDYIGGGPEAAAGSPLQHVATFKAPVLMFHGTLDRNVGVAETRAMSDRLRAAGKQATAVIYPGLDHSLPSGEIRADMLRRSDAFLRATLHIDG